MSHTNCTHARCGFSTPPTPHTAPAPRALPAFFRGQIDAKRRLDTTGQFSAASVKKARGALWAPTNVGFQGHRRFPNIVIENWSAAWKVRRHFEEQTVLRQAQGKVVY